MHLSPRDLDKLLLHGAGHLAQKRLARGLALNYPEAVALLATVILELIRDGDRSVADLMDLGRKVLGRRQVLPGVAALVHEVQVEGTFLDGTKLVTVHDPICLDSGHLELALYGSFLPVPDASKFPLASEGDVPGAVEVADGDIDLFTGRERVTIDVTSRGDRPIQVGSHYPFDQTNRALEFDRALTAGKHLDIPAGMAIRFEPGETRTIALVASAPFDPEALAVTPGALAKAYESAANGAPSDKVSSGHQELAAKREPS